MATEPTHPAATPTHPMERIVAIDILRGFALLGILMMNIQGFAMPAAAYLQPDGLRRPERGQSLGVDIEPRLRRSEIHDDLFVAVRRGDRADERENGRARAARMGRALPAHLLAAARRPGPRLSCSGPGDILVAYALCGFWVYWLRRLRPGWQMALGILVVSIPALLMMGTGLNMQFIPPETLHELRADWKPTATAIETEVAAYRGNWLDQMEARVPASMEFQTVVLLLWTNWRAGGLMLIGMALYRWGVLTGGRARSFYVRIAILGFAIGLPVVSGGVVQNFARNWTMEFSRFGLGAQANYWGSLFVSAGYIGLLMLFARSGALPWLQAALAAVGDGPR